MGDKRGYATKSGAVFLFLRLLLEPGLRASPEKLFTLQNGTTPNAGE